MASSSADQSRESLFPRLDESALTHIASFADTRSIQALGATCQALRAFTSANERIWLRQSAGGIVPRCIARRHPDGGSIVRDAEVSAHLDEKMSRLSHLRWNSVESTLYKGEPREGTAMAAIAGGDLWAVIGGWGEPPFVMRNDIAYVDFGEPQLPLPVETKDVISKGLQAAAQQAFERKAAAFGVTSDGARASSGAAADAAERASRAASSALDITHDPRVTAALLHASPALTGENPQLCAGERWRTARIVGDNAPMRPRYGHSATAVGMPRWLVESADKGTAAAAPPPPVPTTDREVSAASAHGASSSSSSLSSTAAPVLPPFVKFVRQASSTGASSGSNPGLSSSAATSAAAAAGALRTWAIAPGGPHPLLQPTNHASASKASAAGGGAGAGALSTAAADSASSQPAATTADAAGAHPWAPVETLLIYGGMLRGGYSSPSREVYLVECSTRVLALRDQPDTVKEYWRAVARSNRSAGQADTGLMSDDIKECDFNKMMGYADTDEAASKAADDSDASSPSSGGSSSGSDSDALGAAPAAKRRAVGPSDASGDDTSASGAAGAAAGASAAAAPAGKKIRWRVFRQLDVKWRQVKLRGPALEQRGYHAATYAPGTGCIYVSGGIAHGESVCECSATSSVSDHPLQPAGAALVTCSHDHSIPTATCICDCVFPFSTPAGPLLLVSFFLSPRSSPSLQGRCNTSVCPTGRAGR